jgi:hypothetical protein
MIMTAAVTRCWLAIALILPCISTRFGLRGRMDFPQPLARGQLVRINTIKPGASN